MKEQGRQIKATLFKRALIHEYISLCTLLIEKIENFSLQSTV
jgi:hypothetical protein